MAQVDRTEGLVGSTGFKAPVRLASAVNLPSLNGLLTVNGQATAAGDRVLLAGQSDQVQNGFWVVDTAAWNRALDCDGSNDISRGTMVRVNDGSNAGYWVCTTNVDPIIMGQTATQWLLLPQEVADLALASGATGIGYIATGSNTEATTVAQKLQEVVSITDLTGVVADGTTDNTADMLDGIINNGAKVFFVPPKVKYDRMTLIGDATFPTDVVLVDWSMINDYTAAGETSKHLGFHSKDTDTNDTVIVIGSGHHATLLTTNSGKSGTTSGIGRFCSWVWGVGQYVLGSTDKRGWRSGAMIGFGRESASSFWSFRLRSTAPWEAIADDYELWATGQSISGANKYRVNGDNHYKSTGAGTTGASAPVHTSGTVSDGGVSWTWVDSVDRSLAQWRNDGRVLWGSGSFGATFRHAVSVFDTAGSYLAEFVARGVSKVSALKLIPTDSGAAEKLVPWLRAEAVDGLSLMKSDGSTAFVNFNDTKGMEVNQTSAPFFTTTTTSSTPNFAGKYVVYFTGGSATNITSLPSLPDGAEIECHFVNNNYTFVHSSSLMLAGSVNVTPTNGSVLCFRQYPASISSRVVETFRSIK
jgi:uncharacterized membrane protein